MRGRRLVAASYSIAKQIPSEVGLQQDDFSDEKSVLSDTKRKTAVPLFFVSTDGLRLPRIQTYIAKNSYIILIFTAPFFIFCKNDTDITLCEFLYEKNADWNKKIILYQ